MNTPSFQPDPTDHPSGRGKQTSDYRANQLQDAAARTVRVERARLEKLWNMHLDGELSADSKGEFESLCKRYPDLSRELRSTGMLLSGMNLLTADVPASPVTDRERAAAILAAVQSERPFVSTSEARAIRRQRWILAGSAAAILISIVAADRLFPGWKDPAGMVVATRAPDSASANKSAANSAAAPTATVASTATPTPAASRRDGLNAKAQLTLGKTEGTAAQPALNLSTDLIPTMASQDAIASLHATSTPFGLHTNEAWLLQSIARGSTAASRFGSMSSTWSRGTVGPFVASAQLRLTDPASPAIGAWHIDPSNPFTSDDQLPETWKNFLTSPPAPAK